MNPVLLASTLLLAGLGGCATPVGNTSAPALPVAARALPPVTVAPAPADNAQQPAHERWYNAARRAHASGQLALAAELYERVLVAEPLHPGALNALGVVRAQDGRTEQALELFLRARAVDPTAAHVHNNLGYTLLQADRLEEARLALRLASDLEPASVQTLHNLALLSQAEARQKSAGPTGTSPATAPVVQGSAPSTRAPEVVSTEADSPARLVAVAPQVFELRLRPAPAMPEQTTVTPVAAARTVATVTTVLPSATPPAANAPAPRLEVSNGAGWPRLARRTADKLAAVGLPASRLTNERPYRQERTVLQYLAGQEGAVQALQRRLPVPVEAVAVPQLRSRMEVRLVLGRDFTGRAVAGWMQGQDPERVGQLPETAGPSGAPAEAG